MFKNYFKIAIRNLAKQKTLAFINIFGLSVGIACFALFMLYALNEFSFDSFHKNAKNIYRVYLWTEAMNGNEAEGSADHPLPLGPAMKQDLPGVQDYVRVINAWRESFIKTNDKVSREKISFADPQFFSVFSFKLNEGDASTALNDLHNVVLTEETANKIFGKAKAIGQTIEIKVQDMFEPFIVTGIAENLPSNSSITFNMLGSFNFLTANTSDGRSNANNWHHSSCQTYIQLTPQSTLAAHKKSLDAFYRKYKSDEEAYARKNGWKEKRLPEWYGLQPLKSIHTDTKLPGSGTISSVDPRTIWILLSIAAGILLIACINFTTLSIGRSINRAKEVGIRKVIGGNRRSLVLQFLAEALLLSFFSAMLGLLLTSILLPFFNQLSGREMIFSFNQFPGLIWLLAGLILIVGLLAGGYPALVLSGFRPVEILKAKIKLRGSNIFTRSLVTVQFVLSAVLIISTIIILQQLHYMQSKNPGFNKENIIIVDADGTYPKKIYPFFKQQLSASPQIIGVTGSDLGLGGGYGLSSTGFEFNGKHKNVYEYFIDPDYLNVMHMQLLTGRNFQPAITADTVNSVIINETMMKDFGWSIQNAVGQQIKGYGNNLTPVVIGVVKDFNYRSFGEKVAPQMFHQFHHYQPYKYYVRINHGDPAEAVATLRNAWKSVVPDYPFKYSFLNEDLNLFYQSEARWTRIVGWSGGISIFLACLGLLGLAALAAVNRTKEIGIRKVLGASVPTILALLSKDFLKLILIAFIIAAPLAWYLMNKWLQDYAYRINISAWVFIIAGVAIVLIALITISFQSIKTTMANPVESLRTE